MTLSGHRRSIRLDGYDYRLAGAYFVTLVTWNRQPVFGALEDDAVCLLPAGLMTQTHWENLPQHFPLTLAEYIVMPDHLHGIFILHEENGLYMPSRQRAGGTLPGSVGAVIQFYKSSTTKIASRMERSFQGRLWQRNYFEHIIRNEADYDNARRYIMENPLRARMKEDGDFYMP